MLSEAMERLGYLSKTLNKATVIASYSVAPPLHSMALARKLSSQSCQGLGQSPSWKRCGPDSEPHAEGSDTFWAVVSDQLVSVCQIPVGGATTALQRFYPELLHHQYKLGNETAARTKSINLWKVAGALHNPKGIVPPWCKMCFFFFAYPSLQLQSANIR